MLNIVAVPVQHDKFDGHPCAIVSPRRLSSLWPVLDLFYRGGTEDRLRGACPPRHSHFGHRREKNLQNYWTSAFPQTCQRPKRASLPRTSPLPDVKNETDETLKNSRVPPNNTRLCEQPLNATGSFGKSCRAACSTRHEIPREFCLHLPPSQQNIIAQNPPHTDRAARDLN